MEASASTTDSVKLPKPRFGQIVVLQKNGEEPRGKNTPVFVVKLCHVESYQLSAN